METRYDYDHSTMTGMDVDIETSLKEYGLAWIETDTDILFYFGIEYGPNDDLQEEWIKFDFRSIDKKTNVFEEYAWADFPAMLQTAGFTREEYENEPLELQIEDLFRYYGAEEIFGSSYWEGLTYDEIFKRR